MDKLMRDWLDATLPDPCEAYDYWITPWCYSIGIGRLIDHVWIPDRDETVCTECSINLKDWKKVMNR